VIFNTEEDSFFPGVFRALAQGFDAIFFGRVGRLVVEAARKNSDVWSAKNRCMIDPALHRLDLFGALLPCWRSEAVPHRRSADFHTAPVENSPAKFVVARCRPARPGPRRSSILAFRGQRAAVFLSCQGLSAK